MEEIQAMRKDANKYRNVEILNMGIYCCHLSSLLYYISDHLIWIAQIGILKLNNNRYRRLKQIKSLFSLARLVLQEMVDCIQLSMDFSFSSFFVKTIENISNLVIAIHGAGWKVKNRTQGIFGMIAATMACFKFYLKVNGKYSLTGSTELFLN
jgi:hypothetical protein